MEIRRLCSFNFPVDFICEALDQTRGWFYSLLATSTFLFNKNPYKKVLTLGLVLDKDNQKMSKSKKNYVDPTIILDHEGADALRWYLVSANAPWVSTRFYEEAVKEVLGKFILTLWNSYNFFATYAALDSFHPTKHVIANEKRPPLDAWILSRFNHLVDDIERAFSAFEIHKAARAIEDFVTDDFSNWYLRRSRKRLWVEEQTEDKLSGYATMYDIFLGLTKILAPFIPFITEEIYQNIKTEDMPESVHLCDYSKVSKTAINKSLEKGMATIRELVEAGRALRSKIGIKVRYPLQTATIVCTKEVEKEIRELVSLLQDELNVKHVLFSRDTSSLMKKTLKPKFSSIGPRFKDKAPAVTQALKESDPARLYESLQKTKKVVISIEKERISLSKDDFEIVEVEKDHIARTEVEGAVLFLDTKLTKDLEAEGLARELVRRIQSMRKELDLAVEDKIDTQVQIDAASQKLLRTWIEYIQNETRSKSVTFIEKPKGSLVKTWAIDEINVIIGIDKH